MPKKRRSLETFPAVQALCNFAIVRVLRSHWRRPRVPVSGQPGLPMCARRDRRRLIRLVRKPCGGRRAVQVVQAGSVQWQPILTVICLIWRQVIPGIALHE